MMSLPTGDYRSRRYDNFCVFEPRLSSLHLYKSDLFINKMCCIRYGHDVGPSIGSAAFILVLKCDLRLLLYGPSTSIQSVSKANLIFSAPLPSLSLSLSLRLFHFLLPSLHQLPLPPSSSAVSPLHLLFISCIHDNDTACILFKNTAESNFLDWNESHAKSSSCSKKTDRGGPALKAFT